MHGDVWHLAQVAGQTFLLASLCCLFSERRGWLLWSAFFFTLACFTRYSLFFSGILFPFVIWVRTRSLRKFFRATLIFAVVFAFGLLIFLYYNYARFGLFFESGASYMKVEVISGVAARLAKTGGVSPLNILPNIYQQVLRIPEFTRTFPFIKLYEHGFGVLWSTPVFLLIFPAMLEVYKTYVNSVKTNMHTVISIACLLAAVLVTTFMFMLPAHGYMQYSARYTLDFQVFVILFLALQPGLFSARLLWGLLAISVYMNIVGAYLFSAFFTKGIS
jgi:hypothetical protein